MESKKSWKCTNPECRGQHSSYYPYRHYARGLCGPCYYAKRWRDKYSGGRLKRKKKEKILA